MTASSDASRSSDVSVVLDDDHVATIELHRPPENYVDEGFVGEIADALLALDDDLRCRAVLLVSEGKHFCAGAKLGVSAEDIASIPTGDTNPLYDQVARLFQGTIPIVAAVQGAAIGAGLGLALVADFRVACPEARFAATFARLGFHQGFGLSATLPAVVGQQRAAEMLYTGRRVSGEEAKAIGLVDVLVGSDELRGAARALALEIAASAPLAVRAIRRTMRGDLPARVVRATATEHAEQKVLRMTEDYREGVRATAERRPPRFEGR
jgi:enoyl-CoA hydratase/carnithine racemase